MSLGQEVETAIVSANTKAIKSLCHGRVNVRLDDGRTPLVVAIQGRQLGVLQCLLDLGAKADIAWQECVVNPWNPEIMTTDLRYPLQVAIDEKWVDGVVFLLTNGGATEYHCKSGLLGLLQFLVGANCVSMVRLLVNNLKDADLFSITSMSKFTPLLLTAVRLRSLDMIKLLVELGVNVNSIHEDMLPLTIAADMEDMPLCISLMNLGAHLGVQSSGLSNGHMPNPVALAIQVGWYRAMDFLLYLGADPNCEVSWSAMVYKSQILESGSCLLHLAVAKRHLDAVKTLVKHGASLLCTDCSQCNPLHVACKDRDSQLDLVKYLLKSDVSENRCYINARNKQGQTPLLCACSVGNHEVVQLLLNEDQLDMNVFDREGKSCLHHAVQSRSEALVLLLIRNNVSANLSQKNHTTPLQLAVRNGDDTIARILLDYKADPRRSSLSQQSLLHLAVESGNEVLVESLLQLHLNVDALTSAGVTPLMQAAYSGHGDMCQLLIDHNASLNLLSKHQEETAVSMAIYYGLEDNARVLVSEGACLTMKDKRSASPLHWCFHHSRVRSLQLLLLAGVPFTFTDLLKYPQTLTLLQCPDFVHWLFHHITHPRCLQDLCVMRIRRYMKTQSRGKGIGRLVCQLPLPEKLRGYVMLKHLDVQEFDEEV